MGSLKGELTNWMLWRGLEVVLVFLLQSVCGVGFPFLWCHRGLIFGLRTRLAPLLGSRPFDYPISEHTRRLDLTKRQSIPFTLARV